MPKYFTPDVFRFLRELEAHNEKTWWEANKDRYVATIREPARNFIEDFGDRLQSISTHFVADPRVNGGSLMRPYRDMRFSSDDTPYKTNVGIQFRHEQGKDVHAPGFYIHLEPGECFLGVGLWRPEARVARSIRERINEDPNGWENAAHSKAFESEWNLTDDENDRLKRVPKEFDESHPYPDDLRLKSFTAGKRITQKLVSSASFSDDALHSFQVAAPYTRFLCESIGVPF